MDETALSISLSSTPDRPWCKAQHGNVHCVESFETGAGMEGKGEITKHHGAAVHDEDAIDLLF